MRRTLVFGRPLTALQSGSCTSGIYRFRLTHEKYIHVQTKSHMFSCQGSVNREPEFIMSVHSIIGLVIAAREEFIVAKGCNMVVVSMYMCFFRDNEIGGSSESNGSSTGNMSPASVLGTQSSSVAHSPAPIMTSSVSVGSVSGSGAIGTSSGDVLVSASSTIASGESGNAPNSSGANGSVGDSGSVANVSGFSVAPDLDFSTLEMYPNSGWDVGVSESNLDSASDVGFGSTSSHVSPPAVSSAPHSAGSSAVTWPNSRPSSRASASVPSTSAATTTAMVVSSVGFDSSMLSPVGPMNGGRGGSGTPPVSFANSFQFSPLPEPSSVSSSLVGSPAASVRSVTSGTSMTSFCDSLDKKPHVDDVVASSSGGQTSSTTTSMMMMAAAATTSRIEGSVDTQQQSSAIKLRQLLTNEEDEKPSSAVMLGLAGDGVGVELRGADASSHCISGDVAKDGPKGENAILKGLLNEDDEDFDELEGESRRIADDKTAVATSSHHMIGMASECLKKSSNDALLRVSFVSTHSFFHIVDAVHLLF